MSESIDASVIEQLRDVMEDEFVDLVETYLRTAPVELEGIKTAFVQNDTGTIVNRAHTLKGSSANLGAVKLSQLCRGLEMKARSGGPRDLEQLVNDIFAEFTAVNNELRAYCE